MFLLLTDVSKSDLLQNPERPVTKIILDGWRLLPMIKTQND